MQRTSENGETRQNNASRGMAIEKPAERRRAGGDGERGETEGGGDRLARPAEFGGERLQKNRESINQQGREADQYAGGGRGGHTPSGVADAVLSGFEFRDRLEDGRQTSS
jgi:hypothetical protein